MHNYHIHTTTIKWHLPSGRSVFLTHVQIGLFLSSHTSLKYIPGKVFLTYVCVFSSCPDWLLWKIFHHDPFPDLRVIRHQLTLHHSVPREVSVLFTLKMHPRVVSIVTILFQIQHKKQWPRAHPGGVFFLVTHQYDSLLHQFRQLGRYGPIMRV